MADQYYGEIRMFAFNRPPSNWLLCDGSLQDANTYPELFALLGNTYGGNGVTTFGVPDLRGRVPLHQGQGITKQGQPLTNRVLGVRAGSETVALQEAHTPAHGHALKVSTDLANQTSPKDNVLAATSGDQKFFASPSTVQGLTPRATKAMTDTYGGGKAHNNLMPTLGIAYCICARGDYPPRS